MKSSEGLDTGFVDVSVATLGVWMIAIAVNSLINPVAAEKERGQILEPPTTNQVQVTE